MQLRMYTYCSILWIFSVIFSVCTPSPLPQVVPYACGQGFRYANGQCISNEVVGPVAIVTQPCARTDPCCSCQTTSTQICQTTQPCQTIQICQTIQSCQRVQPVQPCQVAQPCQAMQSTQIGQPCAVQQCQTSQPCQTTQTCQTAVTQPFPITGIQPCPNPPPIIYPCPPNPPPPPTTATPPTKIPPTTTPRPITTTTPRPLDPVIELKCPPGTIRIFDYCHLIYCGSGIYRDGKCIITVCPEGTIWTGSRCQQPEPQNQTSVYISNVINTKVDHTSHNHVINYVNNLVINVTESPIVIPPPPPPPAIELSSTPLPPSNCCYIVTPQTCFWEGDQYRCASRKYRRCSSICTAPYIYLKPPTVMQPPTQTCQHHQCEPFYPDCNACDNMIGYSCQTYCQRTICQTSRCQSINLMGYCRSYPGAIGCRRTDGCLNDWCY